MLNYIWLALVLLAVIIGGVYGRMAAVTDGAFEAAKTAVTLALALIGVMALWLGVMRLAEKAGLVQTLARAIRPLMRRLFPDVPPEHPAMGAMLMNMAANMLGLGNAATPLGLRAMADLERLNPRPGTATNAMCTFLAINTSSIQLVPATAVALLSGAGSVRPSAIIGTAFLATLCSTIVGITAVKLLEKLPAYRLPPAPTPAPVPGVEEGAAESGGAHLPGGAGVEAVVGPEPVRALGLRGRLAIAALALFFAGLFAAMVFFPKWQNPQAPGPGEVHLALKSGESVLGTPLSETTGEINVRLADGTVRTVPKPEAKIERHEHGVVRAVNAISVLAVPLLLALFPLYATLRGLKVYEEFVEGAKEGFEVAVRIIPYLVTMLVAIGMFRGAGGIDMLTAWLRPLLDAVRFPPELVPLALMRPLSGSGSNAIFADLIKTFGPDAFITRTAATIIGSTETTFYVIAVYFGAVGVTRTRHAVPAGLLADLAGVIASVLICRAMFG